MDAEKSSSSSFEDLSNLNEQERAELASSVPAPAEANEQSSTSEQTDKPESEAKATEESESECMDILGNGTLLKKVLKKGRSELRPESKDLVTVSYTGRLEDGTVVEEQSNAVVQIDDVEVSTNTITNLSHCH